MKKAESKAQSKYLFPNNKTLDILKCMKTVLSKW